MILDQEPHRDALLQLLEQSTFPGSAIDLVYELKRAITTAMVRPPPADPTSTDKQSWTSTPTDSSSTRS